MSIQFSDVVNNTGIVQRARRLARVDANQWPTQDIANSVNDWLDKLTGYALKADRRFQWDDTNHSKLPIGTTNLISGQSDYSFLTDEQGNSIITLTRIDLLNATGGSTWTQLTERDITAYDYNDNINNATGTPSSYDKIADNIIRLNATPNTNITSGLRFWFQRTALYFTASDTTKAPGFSPLLHRGFVIAAAYDIALSLGLSNLQVLERELEKEENKMMIYFSSRNRDLTKRVVPRYQNSK